jgi:hypothetical protein
MINRALIRPRSAVVSFARIAPACTDPGSLRDRKTKALSASSRVA